MTRHPAAQLELWAPPADVDPPPIGRRSRKRKPASAGLPERPASQPIPRPEEQPTLRLWPDVGQLLGLGRAATYDAARRGDIPIMHFGRRIVVPTARLRQMLGIDTPTV